MTDKHDEDATNSPRLHSMSDVNETLPNGGLRDRAKAVEKVRGWLRLMQATGDLHPGEMEDAMAASLGRWLVAEDPERAARVAPMYRYWFRAVRFALAELVSRGVPTPVALREFHTALLRGTIKEPTGRRGPPRNLGLQLGVRIVVGELTKLGWSVARNPLTKHKNTACDIVAEALEAEDLGPASYEKVRKLYNKEPYEWAYKHLEDLRKEGALGESFEAPEGW